MSSSRTVFLLGELCVLLLFVVLYFTGAISWVFLLTVAVLLGVLVGGVLGLLRPNTGRHNTRPSHSGDPSRPSRHLWGMRGE